MSVFEPYKIKDLELRNKIVMAPMCQYSAKDGIPNDWHTTHYVSRAVGGVALVMVEMTNVEPDGRITDSCLGIWSDGHVPHYKRLVDAVHKNGAKIGIQIAHAGRKAEDAEEPVSSSPIAYNDNYKVPHELTEDEAESAIENYRQGARRAVEAGFDTIEIHGAHGYLIHQFSSPRTNHRNDEYGQDLSLFGVRVIQAVKKELPEGMPLLMRISSKEFAEGGYDLDHGVHLAREFKEAGVDMIHVSAGGEGKPSKDRFEGAYPGYMLPFAKRIKEEAGIPVVAVGLLDALENAERAITEYDADLVALGRVLLRDPHWVLNNDPGKKFVPRQYERGYN
jgi:2,4-dienoyl-CoA reductase-like NADH-dependent reductase (Old Yellow Enzyme family)